MSYEHIWLDDISYDGDLFTGRLSNAPLHLEDLKLGDKVSVATDDVSDWMIVDEDGRLTGGYTLRVLRNRMSPEEQEQFDKESGLVIED